MNVLSADQREELAWINTPEEWFYTGEGGLTVKAPEGADFFNNPYDGRAVCSAPFLYKEYAGSFVLTCRLSVKMKEKYDSGCLMIMADKENWAKLCFELIDGKKTIVSVVTRAGWSDDCISAAVQVDAPYLKIEKRKHCYFFYYSEDGIQWNMVRYFGLGSESLLPIKVGAVAQSPIGKGCEVFFEYMDLSPLIESVD